MWRVPHQFLPKAQWWKTRRNLCLPFTGMRWEFEVKLHRWYFTIEHGRGFLHERWACVRACECV